MSGRLKFFFGILALAALVSGLSFFNVLGITAKSDLDIVLGAQEVNFDIESDEDKDGLTNTEESYWNTDFKNPDTDGDGFVDGEEVSSGHDPLIAGPNDLLPTGENVTQNFSHLTIAGLAEGSLRAGNPNQSKSLSVLADTIIEDSLVELRKNFEPSDIKTIPSNKTADKQYLDNLEVLIRGFSDSLTSEMSALAKILEVVDVKGFKDERFINFFETQKEISKNHFDQIMSVKVPERYKNAHIVLARTAHETMLINNALSQASEDPLKAFVGLNRLVDILFTETLNIVSSYKQLVEANRNL